jgi:hypothetical protein
VSLLEEVHVCKSQVEILGTQHSKHIRKIKESKGKQRKEGRKEGRKEEKEKENERKGRNQEKQSVLS